MASVQSVINDLTAEIASVDTKIAAADAAAKAAQADSSTKVQRVVDLQSKRYALAKAVDALRQIP